MNVKLRKGKWELTHERYVDDMGFERDHFELFDTEKRVHIPFVGMIKVNNKGRNFPINKIPHTYTKEDYRQMLEEQISAYEVIKKGV